MNRRGLLAAAFAAGCAPAFVRRESLMGLWVPTQRPILEWSLCFNYMSDTLTLLAPFEGTSPGLILLRRAGLSDIRVALGDSPSKCFTGAELGLGNVRVLEFT